jgi:hypothetical protein
LDGKDEDVANRCHAHDVSPKAVSEFWTVSLSTHLSKVAFASMDLQGFFDGL